MRKDPTKDGAIDLMNATLKRMLNTPPKPIKKPQPTEKIGKSGKSQNSDKDKSNR
jgi:hypothetical protein